MHLENQFKCQPMKTIVSPKTAGGMCGKKKNIMKKKIFFLLAFLPVYVSAQLDSIDTLGQCPYLFYYNFPESGVMYPDSTYCFTRVFCGLGSGMWGVDAYMNLPHDQCAFFMHAEDTIRVVGVAYVSTWDFHGTETNIFTFYSSDMEQIAQNAERDSIKFKMVEFMADKVGEEYDAHISGIQSYGIYCEIDENHCEGLIGMHDLDGDYYEFDERNYQLVGRRHHKKYQLGDAIRIKVARANIEKRQLDFILADD